MAQEKDTAFTTDKSTQTDTRSKDESSDPEGLVGFYAHDPIEAKMRHYEEQGLLEQVPQTILDQLENGEIENLALGQGRVVILKFDEDSGYNQLFEYKPQFSFLIKLTISPFEKKNPMLTGDPEALNLIYEAVVGGHARTMLHFFVTAEENETLEEYPYCHEYSATPDVLKSEDFVYPRFFYGEATGMPGYWIAAKRLNPACEEALASAKLSESEVDPFLLSVSGFNGMSLDGLRAELRKTKCDVKEGQVSAAILPLLKINTKLCTDLGIDSCQNFSVAEQCEPTPEVKIDAPVVDTDKTEPAPEVKTEEPIVDSEKREPTPEIKAEEPVAEPEIKVEAPVVDTDKTEPVPEVKTEEPIADATKEEPVADPIPNPEMKYTITCGEGLHLEGDVCVADRVEEKIAEPIKDETPVEEVKEESPEEPDLIDKILDYFAPEEKTEPSPEEKVEEPVKDAEPVKEDVPVEEINKEEPVQKELPAEEEKVLEPIAEDTDKREPAPEVKTEEPVADATKEEPVEEPEVKVDEPVREVLPEEKVAEPVVDTDKTEPTPEVKTEEPVADATKEEPAPEERIPNPEMKYTITCGEGLHLEGDVCVADRVEEKIAEPIKDETPVEETNKEEPVKEDVPAEEEKVEEPVADEPKEESAPKEESIIDRLIDLIAPDKKAEEPAPEVKIEAPVVDTDKTEPAPEVKTEEPIVDSEKREPTPEIKAEEPVAEPEIKVEAPVVDTDKTEPVPEVKTEEPIADATKEEPVADPIPNPEMKYTITCGEGLHLEGDVCVADRVEEKIAEPIKDETPVEETNKEEPVKEDVPAEEEKVEEPVADEPKEESAPKEESIIDRLIDLIAPDKKAEEPAPEVKIEEPVADATKEEPVEEPEVKVDEPVRESSPEEKVAEPVADADKTEPTPEVKAEEPVADATKEEPAPEDPIPNPEMKYTITCGEGLHLEGDVCVADRVEEKIAEPIKDETPVEETNQEEPAVKEDVPAEEVKIEEPAVDEGTEKSEPALELKTEEPAIAETKEESAPEEEKTEESVKDETPVEEVKAEEESKVDESVAEAEPVKEEIKGEEPAVKSEPEPVKEESTQEEKVEESIKDSEPVQEPSKEEVKEESAEAKDSSSECPKVCPTLSPPITPWCDDNQSVAWTAQKDTCGCVVGYACPEEKPGEGETLTNEVNNDEAVVGDGKETEPTSEGVEETFLDKILELIVPDKESEEPAKEEAAPAEEINKEQSKEDVLTEETDKGELLAKEKVEEKDSGESFIDKVLGYVTGDESAKEEAKGDGAVAIDSQEDESLDDGAIPDEDTGDLEQSGAHKNDKMQDADYSGDMLSMDGDNLPQDQNQVENSSESASQDTSLTGAQVGVSPAGSGTPNSGQIMGNNYASSNGLSGGVGCSLSRSSSSSSSVWPVFVLMMLILAGARQRLAVKCIASRQEL